MNVLDYVIWYEMRPSDGWVKRMHGRVLTIRAEGVDVEVGRSRIVEVRGAIAASAPTLAELDHKLQELRETHPAEQTIRDQFEARYGTGTRA